MENERLARIEEKTNSNTKKLEEHDKKISELEKTYVIMEKMNCRMGNVEESVENINNKINEESKAKGLKWDKLIDYLFYAVLAFCLFKLGIK